MPLVGAVNKPSSLPYQVRRQAGTNQKAKERQRLSGAEGASAPDAHTILLCEVKNVTKRLPWMAGGPLLFSFLLSYFYFRTILLSFYDTHSIFSFQYVFYNYNQLLYTLFHFFFTIPLKNIMLLIIFSYPIFLNIFYI